MGFVDWKEVVDVMCFKFIKVVDTVWDDVYISKPGDCSLDKSNVR